jgi:hypothetical protein
MHSHISQTLTLRLRDQSPRRSPRGERWTEVKVTRNPPHATSKAPPARTKNPEEVLSTEQTQFHVKILTFFIQNFIKYCYFQCCGSEKSCLEQPTLGTHHILPSPSSSTAPGLPANPGLKPVLNYIISPLLPSIPKQSNGKSHSVPHYHPRLYKDLWSLDLDLPNRSISNINPAEQSTGAGYWYILLYSYFISKKWNRQSRKKKGKSYSPSSDRSSKSVY